MRLSVRVLSLFVGVTFLTCDGAFAQSLGPRVLRVQMVRKGAEGA